MLCSTTSYAIPCRLQIYQKPLSWGHIALKDKMLVPNGGCYREVLLYIIQFLLYVCA